MIILNRGTGAAPLVLVSAAEQLVFARLNLMHRSVSFELVNEREDITAIYYLAHILSIGWGSEAIRS